MRLPLPLSSTRSLYLLSTLLPSLSTSTSSRSTENDKKIFLGKLPGFATNSDQLAVSASRIGCRLSRLAPQQGCHARSSSSITRAATSPAPRARLRRSDYHSEIPALLSLALPISAFVNMLETEGCSPVCGVKFDLTRVAKGE